MMTYQNKIDSLQLETSTLRRGMFTTASDAEFRGDGNSGQISKTLPRNYNKSAAPIMSSMALSSPMSIAPAPVTSSLSTTTASATPPSQVSSTVTGRLAGVLEYLDLDHTNPPPICNNSTISVSTSNLNTQCGVSVTSPWQSNLSHRLSSVSISSSSVAGNAHTPNDTSIGATNLLSGNPSTASGIVYKSVDFIKTEAFMRTRQDAEMARAKNRSKE